MERLTIKFPIGYLLQEPKTEKEALTYINAIANKLGQYEDAEEQKRLFQFPCKVGDTVYVLFSKNEVPRYYECEVEQFIIHSGVVEMNVLIKLQNIRSRLEVGLFGKTVFLSEEEAYQKLKELQNKN